MRITTRPTRVVVMGPSGAGKSAVGLQLSRLIELPFLDADDLHPLENVEKMSRGEALNDADRWPWLGRVGAELASADGLVVACSALTRRYRDVIRSMAPDAFFVELTVAFAELHRRMDARDHFMPASLLSSQLATLESLSDDENGVRVASVEGVDRVAHSAFEAMRHAVPSTLT